MANDSHDVGVIDPPYKRGAGNRIFENAYGKAPCTYRRMMHQYYEALPELMRVVRTGIVAKVQDGCEAGRLCANHIELTNWMRSQYGIALADLAVISTRREAIIAWNMRSDELAAIGAKWRSNSSLEEWFPLTAERIELLEAKVRACGDTAALMVKLGQVSKHWREAAVDYRKRAREWATGDPMHEQRSACADMLENCANALDATVQANDRTEPLPPGAGVADTKNI